MGGFGVWLAFGIVALYAVACECPEALEKLVEILKGE